MRDLFVNKQLLDTGNTFFKNTVWAFDCFAKLTLLQLFETYFRPTW